MINSASTITRTKVKTQSKIERESGKPPQGGIEPQNDQEVRT
jgi:hypothetical protein